MSTLEEALAREPPRYLYRTLRVLDYTDHYSFGHDHRRRGGKPERVWDLRDSAGEKGVVLEDEVGDDYDTFVRRSVRAFLRCMSELGEEGWRLIQFVPRPNNATHSLSDWPVGTHVLIKET